MDRKKLLHTLATLIVVIFFANSLANKFYWYSSVWYFDIFMHLIGGFWVGILALYIFGGKAISFRLFLKAAVLVLLIGAGWEIFEVFADRVASLQAFNVLDTVSDIFFDAAGAAAAVIYYMRRGYARSAK